MAGAVPYDDFLRAKATVSRSRGFEVEDAEVNPLLKPHQRVAVRWAARGGRRALFEAFGLGKTVQQIEILRLILARTGGRALIVAPLGVRQEFRHDAAMLGVPLQFVRRVEECGETEGARCKTTFYKFCLICAAARSRRISTASSTR